MKTAAWMAAAGAMVATVTLASPARAQTEEALKRAFEGKTVTVKIDMPASSVGIDVFADAAKPIDYKAYGDRIKSYGTSIRSAESPIVTLVRVKEKIIEFQLGGGGFGTFGDDTSTSTYIPSVGKSQREKDLERDIKKETDPARKRQMQQEQDRLERDREREDSRNKVVAEAATEEKKARIAQQRLQGGSRFNLRYQEAVPRGITPEQVMAALQELVDFSGGPRPVVAAAHGRGAQGSSLAVSPGAAHGSVARKGMTWQEAEAAFGKPERTTDRMEGTLKVTTAVFTRADQRIEAQFVEGVLIKYAISSR